MSIIAGAIKELEHQKAGIESAIRILRALDGGAGGHTRGAARLSPEGRQRIVEAAKKRWAKARMAKKKPTVRRNAPRKTAARAAIAEPGAK